MANRYTRALRQIKDSTLDEKLKLLEDLPTNNTTGIFVDTPGEYQPQEVITGELDSPLNLEQDGDGEEGYAGDDTTGLFQADGTTKSVEPPGDTSYVLGPMSSMYYGWGSFTQIGYIRQSDRRMVNLARITGSIESWDGTSGFTSYGQLTLEQAVWFRDQSRSDYRAFYPGPPSNPADEYGRYLSQIVDTGKSVVEIIRAIFTPGTNKGFDPSDVFSSILSLILRSDDPSFGDALKSLGVAGKVYLGYLTNLLGDTIDNEFLGQDYVNDSFANMELGYDNNGKLISSVGDNVIGSGQYPTYNPTTNEIELNFNYDFKSNVEEFKDKEGLYGGLAGEIQKGVYNALSPYSVDAQVAAGAGNPLGPLSGAVFGTLINTAKGLGGGKPTPGKITISPQQLQQINPEAYNQLVNSGNVPSDAVDKPSQNKQVPADGVEVDPEKAIESLKQKLPADKRAQLDFQQTMSMDNFNKLSKSDQNKVMDALKKRHVSKRDGSNFIDAPKHMRDMFKASAKEAGKTKFKDGYMIDKDPNTGKTRKTPIFSTIPGRSSVLAMGNEPSGKLLTENQKRALRNVKKPVQVKEIPTKVKVKPTSRKNKTVGVDMMKVPDTPKEYKPQIDIWSKEDYAANVRASQEKKNHVLEMLGAAEHHWSYLTEEKRRKKQERVNEELAAKYDREMEDLYERYKARQDKVDKTISSFKKPADIAPEYPKDPPPQMVNGYHPKYGKQYKHDKLDPQSAEAMPPTGNPEVDANIKKATNTKEKQRKSKILYKSVRENNYWNRLQKWRYCGALLDESMTTAGLGMINLEPSPNVLSNETSAFDSESANVATVVSGGAVKLGVDEGQPFTDLYPGSANTQYRQASFTFDSTRYDTLVINITNPGGGQGSWCDPNCIFDNIIRYSVYDMDNTDNLYQGTLSNGDNTIRLPSNVRVKEMDVYIRQFASNGVYSDGYNPPFTINSISTKRLSPISLFVALDDPEANAFVRDGTVDKMSPAEKKKKLEEQLAASEEYLNKMFGSGMPKGATVISDVQAQQTFMDIRRAQGLPYTDEDDAFDSDYYKGPSPDLDDDSDFDPDSFEYAGTNWDLYNWMNKTYGLPAAEWKKDNPTKPDASNPYLPAGSYVPKAQNRNSRLLAMVAHHEPEGKVLSEKKRLKSPKSLADKIPGYYDGKPSPLGFPVEEPPKMKNGMHPDLVDGKKVSQRYNRLDPTSAKAMPPTGNPHIDKKVRAAAKKPK